MIVFLQRALDIAIDSKGTLYTSEVGFGRRVQKFMRVQ
jgi:hypothetical protein